MLKSLIALVLFALAAVTSPAQAQAPPTTSAGTLTCQTAPSGCAEAIKKIEVRTAQ